MDMVNNPAHYTAGGIETIDYIKAKLTPEEYRGYLKGQVMKYTSRAGKKHDEAEDYRKAAWYLGRLLRELDQPSGEVRPVEGQPGTDDSGTRGVFGHAVRLTPDHSRKCTCGRVKDDPCICR